LKLSKTVTQLQHTLLNIADCPNAIRQCL